DRHLLGAGAGELDPARTRPDRPRPRPLGFAGGVLHHSLIEEGIPMKLGVVFPQTEIGSDPAVVRDYAQAAESAGYDHLLVFDHVLGSKEERFDKLGRKPPYTDQSAFHEVFVLFGYLAAPTRRLELVTGIVILPQRQTALVAKQAAAVDVLSGGRLRLGVGVGWDPVGFEALGEGFHTRGRRG